MEQSIAQKKHMPKKHTFKRQTNKGKIKDTIYMQGDDMTRRTQ